MNKAEATEKLNRTAHAVSTAALLIKMERETIDSFLKESRKMESVGPILDPTLFKDSERRAVDALLRPTFQAALDFLNHYEAQQTTALAALAVVNGGKTLSGK